eukprot:7193188-Prymnesium_polylepis.1
MAARARGVWAGGPLSNERDVRGRGPFFLVRVMRHTIQIEGTLTRQRATSGTCEHPRSNASPPSALPNLIAAALGPRSPFHRSRAPAYCTPLCPCPINTPAPQRAANAANSSR